jgi:hypothetical protein
MNAGPVADQPIRPRTPPGVGTPLRANRRLVGATRARECELKSEKVGRFKSAGFGSPPNLQLVNVKTGAQRLSVGAADVGGGMK